VRELDATAVVAFDDLIAWGLITRLQELGVDVPGELSVAGFDDAIEEGMLRPALTSISPHGAGLGREAMDLLPARLSDEGGEPAVRMPSCTLLTRASTAAPRS